MPARRPKLLRLTPHRVTGLLVLLSVLPVLGIGLVVRSRTHEHGRAGLRTRQERMGTRLVALLEDQVGILRRLGGLFSGKDAPSDGDWQTGVRSLELPREPFGLDGLIHVASLPASELDSFRARFPPDVLIQPRAQRDEHWIVLHASAAPYTRARGLDLGSSPRLSLALGQACDRGEEVFTGRDHSLGSTQERAVALCFLPIYRTRTPPPTVEARRSELRGWAGAVLHVPTLLAAAIGADAAELEAKLIDDASADFRDGLPSAWEAWGSGAEDTGPLDLQVRGTSWKLLVRDRPDAGWPSAGMLAPLVAIGILLGLATFRIVRGGAARAARPAPGRDRPSSVAAEAPRGSRALRILLVEDQPMNRELSRRLLAADGHSVDEAVNGHEALQKAADARYDLVLLDLQMPGMDGFETARALRQLEGSAPRTPIIALTARVLEPGDQSCREAGMDDYLRKPFQPQEMKAMLHKWVPTGPEPPEGRPAAPPPERNPGNARPQDQDLVSRLDELGVLKDPTLTARLIRIFVEDSARVIADLDAAIARNDGAAAARLGHRLLSASLSIGASALAGLARRMEQEAEALPPAQAAGLLREVRTEFEEVRAFVGTLSGGG